MVIADNHVMTFYINNKDIDFYSISEIRQLVVGRILMLKIYDFETYESALGMITKVGKTQFNFYDIINKHSSIFDINNDMFTAQELPNEVMTVLKSYYHVPPVDQF